MLRIWGRVNSINVQKVLWCADELGIPYERLEAGMEHGVVETPAYRRLNPNGRIPTIEHDGLVLWESNAIVRYLVRRWPSEKLRPCSLEEEADADRWMDWVATMLGPAISPVFWGLVRTPPERRDSAAIAAACAQTASLFEILDERLATSEYVTGDRLSVADIPLGAYAHRWFAMNIPHPPHRNVRRWYRLLARRSAYRNRVMLPLS